MTRPTPQTLADRAAQHAAEQAAAIPATGGPAGRPSAPVAVSGASSLVRSLEALGVEVAFGIPGGAILPAYDPLYDSTVRHILVRHEQGAGHAATGYAEVIHKFAKPGHYLVKAEHVRADGVRAVARLQVRVGD